MKIAFPGRRSDNLEDVRGGGGAGGGFGLPIGIGAGLGVPGLIVTLLLAFVFGGNPFGGGGGGFSPNSPFQQFPRADQVPAGQPIPASLDPNANTVDFVSFVLDDVQGSWARSFAAAGKTYQPAKLVLFSDAVASGCGEASAATGPFYCPLDQHVYLDIAFFQELAQRFGAPGDFAQAYVIAHELGHHVQQLTGIGGSVQKEQQARPDEGSALSVRLELQADCLAGVWGYTAGQRGLLEPGDVEEGLAAAASVGDDRIQRAATGRVDPETWTHGSADQRSAWFRRGFERGDAAQCNTFSGDI